MEMGTFQRVVEYFVVQKITKPATDHYFYNPQHKNLWKLIFSNINYRSKSVRQVIVKGDYIVMSRSLHERTASLIVFLPNTSSPARTNWEGILGESRVIRE